MPDSVQLYNHTAKLFGNKQVDLTNIRVMLLDSDATFNAAHTAVSSIEGDEVFGNGWDEGGELIGSVAVTTVTTNDAMLDGDNVSVNASGGPIGPASFAAIIDATNGYPLAFITFEEPQTATAGNPMAFTWDADGIFRWVVT